MTHSKLVQRRIASVAHADKEFANVTTTAEGFSEVPIVLVPKPPRLLSVALNVPSGPFVLWQKWHRNMGQLSPGVRWIWPGWCQISHIVSRATITYNAPTRNCPTADKVMVDVDLSLIFRIGPDANSSANFVYKLGVHRFDELLVAETQDSIRRLIYSVAHDKVIDMHEEFATVVLSDLNLKFNAYGVQMVKVNITDIKLPSDLQDRIVKTIALKTKLSEQQTLHENRVRMLEDEATRSIETIRKSHARKLQEITADRKRYEIERREMEENARGKARVEEIKAMTAADVALKKILGCETVQKVKARQEAEALLKKTHITCQAMKIEAEQKVAVDTKQSEAELAIAESKAAAMVARAEVESDCVEALKEKRRYELEWERLRVLETIAGSKSKKFITGKKGDAILKELIPEM